MEESFPRGREPSSTPQEAKRPREVGFHTLCRELRHTTCHVEQSCFECSSGACSGVPRQELFCAHALTLVVCAIAERDPDSPL